MRPTAASILRDAEERRVRREALQREADEARAAAAARRRAQRDADARAMEERALRRELGGAVFHASQGREVAHTERGALVTRETKRGSASRVVGGRDGAGSTTATAVHAATEDAVEHEGAATPREEAEEWLRAVAHSELRLLRRFGLEPWRARRAWVEQRGTVLAAACEGRRRARAWERWCDRVRFRAVAREADDVARADRHRRHVLLRKALDHWRGGAHAHHHRHRRDPDREQEVERRIGLRRRRTRLQAAWVLWTLACVQRARARAQHRRGAEAEAEKRGTRALLRRMWHRWSREVVPGLREERAAEERRAVLRRIAHRVLDP